jgi:hypothetical protein
MVKVGKKCVESEFFVIEEKGPAIISKQLSIDLDVLKFNIPESAKVYKISDALELKEKYPECFEGVGKLKDFQLVIPINPDVKPVVQPARRIPYNLRDKLKHKLDELVKMDIIERVDGPSKWISPVVVVPKANSQDIRLCVDMREANKAVVRERYQIPTVEMK